MRYSENFAEKVGACRELYLEHGGKDHELIEKKMRAAGFRDFNRRSLYRRFERGYCKPGWIETYGWDYLLKQKSEPPASAGSQFDSDENIADKPTPMISKSSVSNDGRSAQHNWPPAHAGGSDTVPQLKPAPRLEEFEEFKRWLKRTWPNMTWEWKHQVYIYKHLKRVLEGACKRLMIFVPPRHGKSELVTVRFPAWTLKHKPGTKIIIGSYNQRLANRFSRMVRSAVAEDEFREKEANSDQGTQEAKVDFGEHGGDSQYRKHDRPEQMNCGLGQRRTQDGSGFMIRRANSEAEWETTQGGGVRAVGVGAGVTGYGADLIIIDDPVKSRAEAESQTYRDKLYDWFNDDIYTRLEPDGKIILIQTRWHEDDLAGRLLREAAEEGGEQWEVVNLPALAEGNFISATHGRADDEEKGSPPYEGGVAPASGDGVVLYHTPHTTPSSRDADAENHPVGETPTPLLRKEGSFLCDPLGRKVGEALCPERFNEEKLDQIRRKLGSYSFAALYQQRPTPAEGGLFKRAWFRTINTPPPNLRWKRGYDLGISTNATADYTASLRVGYDKTGTMYIDGGFRKRIEYPEQRRYILGRIAAEPDTEHGIELSANGNAVVQDLRREPRTRGRPLRGVKVKGDKVTRALPWIALAEEGKVFLVKGHWNTEFIDEAARFPSGTHDDQIDAVSIAVRMHRDHSNRLYVF